MPAPNNRLEFEHNIYLTLEEIHFKISNNISDPGLFHMLMPALEKLQIHPNKRMDLGTIETNLRLHSNMNKWTELLRPGILRDMEKKESETLSEKPLEE